MLPLRSPSADARPPHFLRPEARGRQRDEKYRIGDLLPDSMFHERQCTVRFLQHSQSSRVWVCTWVPANVVDSLLFVLVPTLQNLQLNSPDNSINNNQLRGGRVAERERCVTAHPTPKPGTTHQQLPYEKIRMKPQFLTFLTPFFQMLLNRK